MGLTRSYNPPVPEDVGVSIIVEAFKSGVTFFDTSDIYGPRTNEILVGKVTVFQSLPMAMPWSTGGVTAICFSSRH